MTRRLLLLTLAAGCAHSPTFAGSPAPPLPTAPREARPFTVGVARADITPPPGAATFGHGPDAHLAMGYWTRLECRAFVFSSGPTPAEQLAIVPCDLPAMGHLLHRMVAQRVEALLPASRLMLTATHTHAGTAHYLESQAFGGATSTRWPGFDPRMAEFLADRIAAAIREAFGARAPARLRWVHGEVWGLTRNRSLDAYRLDDPPYLAADAGVERPFDERAIDPALDVLQLQRQDDGGTLGWLVFFAMHPTVLPASNRLFGGDVYGVATRALEEAVGGGAVVGVVNTNEGDLVPTSLRPTEAEAIRLGRRLAAEALAAVAAAGQGGFLSQAPIDARWLELDLDQVKLGGRGLCQAELGQAALRGGSDHRSSTEFLLGDASDLDPAGECWPRRKGMGPLQDHIAGREGYLDHVALALVRLGPVLLPFVPAELTLTAGHRLGRVVLAAGPPAERAIIAGLANAYIEYVTTPEEFNLQAYEGGSTLYGPLTLGLLGRHFETLARSLKGEDVALRASGPGVWGVDRVAEVTFAVAPEHPRLARAEFNDPAEALGQARGFRTLCRLKDVEGEPPRLCAVWGDVGPGRIWADPAGAPALVRPWVSLSDAHGPLLDDRGVAFRVRTRGPWCGEEAKAWRWTALITPSAEDWTRLQGHTVTFRVESHAAAALVSEPFTASDLPAGCGYPETWLCLKESPVGCTPAAPTAPATAPGAARDRRPPPGSGAAPGSR